MFFLLIACIAPEDSLTDVLPTEEQLRINLPTDTTTAKEFTTTDEMAPYYSTTRSVTEHVNGMITWVLGTVYAVTKFPPSEKTDNRAFWGPYSDSGLDPVETGLWVERAADGSHTWAIVFISRTDASEQVPVVAGYIEPGSTRLDAIGSFVVDFDTAASLDPAVAQVGTFAVEYDYDSAGVAAVALFEDYGAEGGQLYDAAYAYTEDYTGAGSMDLAWLEDINGAGAEELATLRSRWQADGAGRGDAVLSGGDLGSTVVTASNCWGTAFTTTYWTDTANYQPTVGVESDCAFTPAEYAEESHFTLQ